MADTCPHTVTCGCGWTAESDNPDVIRALMSDHDCPNAPEAAPDRWWEAVFSFWGLLIALVIAVAVVEILTGEALIR